MNKILVKRSLSLALATIVIISSMELKTFSQTLDKQEVEAKANIQQAHKWSNKTSEKIIQNDNGPDFTSLGGDIKRGDYVVYNDNDFKDGNFKTMLISISAMQEDKNKKVEVRLDSESGQLLGTIDINPSNNSRVFKEHYIDIPEVTGTHNIVFVFKDDMSINMDWFTVSSYTGTETEDEFNERMKWFRDARFGQFVHFGSYAYAGGEYKGKRNTASEWIMNDLRISKEDYQRDIAKNFNPSEFSAKDLVQLAKDAGQKYLVFTSRHHEGFSMYDTEIREFKDYELMSYGDYKGPDPMAEIAKECKEQGIKFGAYYTIFDWHDKSQSNYGNTINASEKEEYKTRMKGQLRELIEKYDVELLWFDGEWPSWWTKEDGREFYKYLRTIKPSLVINNRVGKRHPDDGDYGTPENEIPSTGLDYDWESCMTLNSSWGYHKYDNGYKNANTVIYNLVDTASKGGNYLLNVGPDGQGIVPEESAVIFREVGAWMDKYGDSIYGTDISCFTKLPNGVRATTKDGKVYLHFNQWNQGDMVKIPALKNNINYMKVMGKDVEVDYIELKGGLLLEIPQCEGDIYNTVIEIDVEGTPETVEEANVNIATKATKVIETNYYQNDKTYIGKRAVDGNENTRWATDNNTNSAILELTFEKPVTFNKAYFKTYVSSTNKIDSYNIEYWDGQEWKIGYKGGSIGATGEVNFEPISADKVRLNITKASNPSIYEFQLFNEDLVNIDIISPTESKIVSSEGFLLEGTAIGGNKVEISTNNENESPITFEAPIDENGNWNVFISNIGEGNKRIRAFLKNDEGEIIDVINTSLKVRNYGKNLVVGKPISVSSEYNTLPGYEKIKAIDEDLATRWAPRDDDRTPTMTVDFGEKTTFDTVVISEMLDTWITPNRYRCLKFKLEYSDNGQWKEIHQGTTIGEELILKFNPVIGEKIRLTIVEGTSHNNNAPTNIVEFEVYNTTKEVLKGDFNNDGVINIIDLAIVSRYYGTTNPKYDLNADGIVDDYEVSFITNIILGL